MKVEGPVYTITEQDIRDVEIYTNNKGEIMTGSQNHGVVPSPEYLRKQAVTHLKMATQCEAVAAYLEFKEDESVEQEAVRLFNIAYPDWEWKVQAHIIKNSFYRLAKHNLKENQ